MPTPTIEEDPTPSDPWASLSQSPAAPKSGLPASSKQPQTQPSIDAWAAPVEPSHEVKTAENNVLAASLAGLDGDAWGGSSFGPNMGPAMTGAEPIGKAEGTTSKVMPKAEPTGKVISAMGMPLAALIGKADGVTSKGMPMGQPGKATGTMGMPMAEPIGKAAGTSAKGTKGGHH